MCGMHLDTGETVRLVPGLSFLCAVEGLWDEHLR